MIRTEDGDWLTMGRARAACPELDLTRSWELGDVPEPENEEDLGAYLRRIGFSDQQMRYVQRSFANAEGESMRYLNAMAHAHLFKDSDGADDASDYRILDGYDSYVDKLAEGLDIRLGSIVEAIDWTSGAQVTTVAGEVQRAEAAIVTLPLGVLQAGRVRVHAGFATVQARGFGGPEDGTGDENGLSI